ncbi:hypothetical protein D1AOALGA4SA_3262 [Olavius algarvensis Delta 1 endosymbiont]|nr:hypothetical protein D1AOALGA4SA_3262 [Olavius algarvensis Delta 1 endosymbiont]
MIRNFIYVLVVVKGLMVVWGILGFVEYFAPSVTFGLQDTNFPLGTQFLHWLLLLLTGAVFIVGFLLSWSHTPFATVTMYATLATLCFVETLDFNAFGGGSNRFFIMAAEYVLYIALSTYLLRSKHIKQRFGYRACA